MDTPNESVISRATGGSLADRAAGRVRRKMYRRLAALVPLETLESVLDVGVTADRELVSSNFFEELYPHPERITALSNQDARWMETHFRGLSFVQSSALAIPFAGNSFDLVFSNAVIEHVGRRDNQKQLLKECARVARRFVFLTTPNRYHPMEFHTVLPLIHFLPKKMHRAILKKLGMDFFAREENLNLLSKQDMSTLARQAWTSGVSAGSAPNSWALYSERFLGFTSNLLLFAKKGAM
ncbi:MAG: class I SAM-dependent methyltransferase [Zoogloeaceae bacterium]|jgi:SAM-dependent methyltransferase|nr:class I SAM-dependent methyltransferase [Zoogloeaceae bacterium]